MLYSFLVWDSKILYAEDYKLMGYNYCGDMHVEESGVGKKGVETG